MTNFIDLKSCTADEFYHTLHKIHGIAPINAKIHKILCDMQNNLSTDAKKVLYIYFSLLDDGNTRLALDTETALHKWLLKFNSLLKLYQTEESECPLDPCESESAFHDILDQGIRDLLTMDYTNIIERREVLKETEKGATTQPFVCVTDSATKIDYLYATRYFDAKCVIERRSEIFPKSVRNISTSEKEACRSFFLTALNEPFDFTDRQLEAIIRGQDENLIITGGPGTGKTTTICFLLWKLLKDHADMLNWEIKLAAPSGKAADRMRESLLASLSKFKDNTCDVYHKIHNLESYTLHRLLSYSPTKNQFIYNSENHFPSKYLFIIDEASMIDIDLFARFMDALPETDFKLFILGDPDQLPSVQAGAVLGEMLATSHFATQLNESKRFDDSSKIGKLALAIQKSKDHSTEFQNDWPIGYPKPQFSPFTEVTFDRENAEDVIHTFSLSESKDGEKKDIERLIRQWVQEFYKNTQFIENAKKIYVRLSDETNLLVDENGQPVQRKTLDDLWKITENARILSANRSGITGVENLNLLVRKELGIQTHEPFFVGEILMLTENQAMYKLYNGDCGIVLGEKDSGRLYLMLKKARTQTEYSAGNTDETTADYITYPLSQLPTKALESAFAITIHKSQGSGFKNILMFLPKMEGHPLLNNQMIYTGVTRTEKNSLTIVTTQSAFEAGCKTVITRDTGIDISNHDGS